MLVERRGLSLYYSLFLAVKIYIVIHRQQVAMKRLAGIPYMLATP